MKITIDDLKKLKASDFKNIEDYPKNIDYLKNTLFECLIYKASKRVHDSGYRCFDIYAYDGENIYGVGWGDSIQLPFDDRRCSCDICGHMNMDVLDSGFIRLFSVAGKKIKIHCNCSDFMFSLVRDK